VKFYNLDGNLIPITSGRNEYGIARKLEVRLAYRFFDEKPHMGINYSKSHLPSTGHSPICYE
jgi:hypothetical protein